MQVLLSRYIDMGSQTNCPGMACMMLRIQSNSLMTRYRVICHTRINKSGWFRENINVRLITKVYGFDGFHIGPILIDSYIVRAKNGSSFFLEPRLNPF